MIEVEGGTHTVIECCYMLLREPCHRLSCSMSRVNDNQSETGAGACCSLCFILCTKLASILILSTSCVQFDAHVLIIDWIAID